MGIEGGDSRSLYDWSYDYVRDCVILDEGKWSNGWRYGWNGCRDRDGMGRGRGLGGGAHV